MNPDDFNEALDVLEEQLVALMARTHELREIASHERGQSEGEDKTDWRRVANRLDKSRAKMTDALEQLRTID